MLLCVCTRMYVHACVCVCLHVCKCVCVVVCVCRSCAGAHVEARDVFMFLKNCLILEKGSLTSLELMK